ncbi:MAG TPA: alpha/beta hydrolase [Micromonosporaceae bacterium]|nr:alpha/beta hydrolase [Micromonosporaceae bacterium]
MTALRQDFLDAYDAMLGRWPVSVGSVDVPGRLGLTHVNMCGAADGPAVVLLHGGGATSTVWYGVVGDLVEHYRVYAIDAIGDLGRSIYNGAPIGGAAGLTAWLDEVLDAVRVTDVAAIAGHSYGAWVAMRYTLHAPDRVRRLVLLDPTECFIPVSLRYKLRAIPLMVRGSTDSYRSFYRWETRGRPLDSQWFELAMTKSGGKSGLVWPKRPSSADLRQMRTPTLVFVANRSRQQSPKRLASVARRTLASVEIEAIPEASHFTLPTEHAPQIGAAMARFLQSAAARPAANTPPAADTHAPETDSQEKSQA